MIETGMAFNSSVSEGLHSFVLVWLCPVDMLTNSSLNCFKNIDIITSVEGYESPFECISRLSELKNEKIILVLSNALAKNVIFTVHDMTNVFFIYLSLNDSETDTIWMHEYPKVHGLYSNVNNLVSQIVLDIAKLTVKVDTSTSLNNEKSSVLICNLVQSDASTEKMNDTAADFISFQIFIDIFLSFPEPAKKCGMEKLIQICKEIYHDNDAQLKHIDHFQREYTPKTAIMWFIRDIFLARVLNQALHRFDLTIIFAFRPFIVDLYTELSKFCIEQNEKLRQGTKIFAGMSLPANELQDLITNVGSFMFMRKFLEASADSAVAAIFSGEGHGKPHSESVVFEISIDPNLDYVRPFANISTLSCLPDEQLVLFSPGFIFRIESVDDISDNIWLVRLTFTNEVQEKMKELIEQFKMDLDMPLDYITYGNVLNKLNRMKDTEKYYELLLDMFPSLHQHSTTITNILGSSYYLQKNYSSALGYFRKALDSYQLSHQIEEITEMSVENETQFNQYIFQNPKLHQHLGIWPRNARDLRSALLLAHGAAGVVGSLILSSLAITGVGSIAVPAIASIYFSRYLKTLVGEFCEDSQLSNLVSIYNNIGSLYLHVTNYKEALRYFQMTLTIALDKLPSKHPIIRHCLYNMGSTYLHTKNYDLSLEYFQKAFDVALSVLSSEHPFICQSLHQISLVTRLNSGGNDVIATTKNFQNLSTVNDEDHVSS